MMKDDFIEVAEHRAALYSELAPTIDLIHDRVDEMLRAGEFQEVNDLFDRDTTRLCTDVLYSILSATLPAKSKLPGREDFYQRAFATIQTRPEGQDGATSSLVYLR